MQSANFQLWVFSSTFVFEWLPRKPNFGFKTAGINVAVPCMQKSIKGCDILKHPERPPAEYPLPTLAQGKWVTISSAEIPKCPWTVIFYTLLMDSVTFKNGISKTSLNHFI